MQKNSSLLWKRNRQVELSKETMEKWLGCCPNDLELLYNIYKNSRCCNLNAIYFIETGKPSVCYAAFKRLIELFVGEYGFCCFDGDVLMPFGIDCADLFHKYKKNEWTLDYVIESVAGYF